MRTSVTVDARKDDPRDGKGPSKTMQRSIRNASYIVHVGHLIFV